MGPNQQISRGVDAHYITIFSYLVNNTDEQCYLLIRASHLVGKSHSHHAVVAAMSTKVAGVAHGA